MPRDVTAHLLSSEFSVDGLQVLRLSGHEALSEVYTFAVDVVATASNAPFGPSLVGSQVAVVFTAGGGVERVIGGIVAEVTDGLEPSSGLRTYQLKVRPRLHRLSQVTLTEKFSGNLAEVLVRKLELCDVPYETLVSTTYLDPPLTFRAQFAESDLDFLKRRCEHFGVAFYFRTTRQGDVVVFTDDGRFVDRRRELVVPFRARGEETDVFRLAAHARMIPSLFVVSDYDYRRPNVDIVGRTQLEGGTGGGVVEYGANVKSPQDALTLSQVRAEEQASQRLVFEGESDRSELFPGLRFTLEGHPAFGDLELLVTSVDHEIAQPARGSDAAQLHYRNRFRAIPANVPFRPARVTRRPQVAGVISAIVLAAPEGPATQPWLDERGRYRVQLLNELFHLSDADRRARAVRMLQVSAGAGFGMHFPLRPGTEVMVAFVNGDPDRPIIVGAVPNELTPSPVRNDDALFNRITTASGIEMEFEDAD